MNLACRQRSIEKTIISEYLTWFDFIYCIDNVCLTSILLGNTVIGISQKINERKEE